MALPAENARQAAGMAIFRGPDFKTSAFNRSATLPRACRCYALARQGPQPLDLACSSQERWPRG